MAKLELVPAPDIDRKVREIVTHLSLQHINPNQVVSFRSYHSKARARARIYSMPRIWQQALNLKPHYCIEFISQHFDHLNPSDQIRVVIHELLHIPKTFSGALVPHKGKSRRHQVTHQTVEKLLKLLQKQ